MIVPLLLLAAAGLYAASVGVNGIASDIGDVRPDVPSGDDLTLSEDDTRPGAPDTSVPDFTMTSHYGQDTNDMRTSAAGRTFIENLEGFSAKAYSDHKGYSIGYGHLIRAGDGLTRDSIVTPQQADALMSQDLGIAENAVNNAVDVVLTQNEFDACVSFCYNIGVGAFTGSTFVRRLNAGDDQAISELSKWVNASGQRNASLVSRRAAEQNLFLA